MAHTVAVDLPERSFAALARFAAEQGQTMEELAAVWLAATVDRLAEDPVVRLAGAVSSGYPDLLEDPDALIADQLEAERLDQEDQDTE